MAIKAPTHTPFYENREIFTVIVISALRVTPPGECQQKRNRRDGAVKNRGEKMR